MKKILLSFILVLCTFVMVGCNKKVTVKFISSLDETIISEETVISGETINAPTPKVYVGYKFSGWDKELASLKEDDIVYALYEKNIYTVIFKSSIDDLVIDTIDESIVKFILAVSFEVIFSSNAIFCILLSVG